MGNTGLWLALRQSTWTVAEPQVHRHLKWLERRMARVHAAGPGTFFSANPTDQAKTWGPKRGP